MKAISPSMIVVFWCCITLVLEAADASFDHANQLARAGDHGRAIEQYQSVLSEKGPSFAVLYNLGGCYLAQGDYGQAMLCYERARLLSPRDRDLRKNIELTRKAAKIAGNEATPGLWRRLLEFFSREEWSRGIVLLSALVALLSLIAFLVRTPRKGLRAILFGGAALALFGITLAAYALVVRKSEDQLAVILARDSSLRLSPFAKADVLTACEAGRIVRIEMVKNDFSYIHLLGTESRGWVANNELARIIPVAGH